MRDTLESKRLLAPEARTTLTAEVNASGVETIKSELAATPQNAQVAVAKALRDLVFSDRKRVARLDYAVRNDLHELLERYEMVGNVG